MPTSWPHAACPGGAFSPVATSSCPAPSATAMTMEPFCASVWSTCAKTSCNVGKNGNGTKMAVDEAKTSEKPRRRNY